MCILRYPRGKTRALAVLEPLLPHDIIYSPFLGGGAVELHLAAKFGTRIHGNDVFEPLSNFWQQAVAHQSDVAATARGLLPMTALKFAALKRDYPTTACPLQRAAAFYALNRASFNGGTFSSGFSATTGRFTDAHVDRLATADLSRLSVANLDCLEFIAGVPEDGFLFMDPPYLIEQALYGHTGSTHRGFDHAGLRRALEGRRRFLLCYNDCPEVRELYAGFDITPVHWAYSMGKNWPISEVVIQPR